MVRNQTFLQVKINGTEYFRKTISATGQLDAQVLFLGAFPPNDRVTRQTVVHGESMPMMRTENVPGFKGVIQDVQITNGSRTMVVEFFPLILDDDAILPPQFGNVSFDYSLVLEGVVSDDACRDDPCLHDGSCSITWNDFVCECPRGYKGKRCDEKEFCQLQDCPEGSRCNNLDDGYECIANTTFDGTNRTFIYRMNGELGKKKLDSIDITYRSKKGNSSFYQKLFSLSK